MVVVAQLVRAPDCGSGSRRFEPDLPPLRDSVESLFFIRINQLFPYKNINFLKQRLHTLIYKKDLFWQFIVISKTKSRIMDLKKILQVLGIIALSLFVIQLILGLVLSFAIGGFIFNAVDKIEDKIEIIDLSDVKVDIIDDEDSIHINSNSQKKNNSKEKVLIIMGNDTIVNIQKNKK